MKPESMLRTGTLLLTLALSGIAQAHDAWIDTAGPRHAVLYGHGDKIDAYDKAKIKRVQGYDNGGKQVDAKVDASGERAVVTAGKGASMLTLEFDNGFWCKVDDEWKNQPKTQVPGATESSHSLKFGKTVLVWGAGVARPTGMRMEIVPLVKAAPKSGGTMDVQVLYEGKPLPGAKLYIDAYDEAKTVTTDADGKARVPVRKGSQVIGAGHKIDLASPEADKVSFGANLAFTAR